MRLDRFDLNLLVALDILLEECNVTRASDRLHIGQSAASAALARLREYFGDELLVPVGRRLQRTPLAESLVEPVRSSLSQLRATLAQKPGFDPATAERRIRLCASDYAVTVLLGEVARRVSVEAPGLVLDMRLPGPDVFDSFERGLIDLLFMPETYLASTPGQRARLFEDSHVCVVWSGHADIGETPFTMAQYMALGHVVVHFGNESSVAFEEWFLPRVGQQRRIELIVSSFSLVPLVLVGTQRVALMHRRQAEHVVAQAPLRLLQAPFKMPPLVEMMCWPNHLDQDPAHVWLRRLVHDCAAGLA